MGGGRGREGEGRGREGGEGREGSWREGARGGRAKTASLLIIDTKLINQTFLVIIENQGLVYTVYCIVFTDRQTVCQTTPH